MEFPQLTEEEKAALFPSSSPDEPESAADEPGEPEVAEEETAKEEPKEEPEEKPAEKEPELDASAYARMRWEASEAKRKLAEKDAEIEALKNPPKPIPSRDENYEGHVEGRIETVEERLARMERAEQAREAQRTELEKVTGALQELSGYEASYAKAAPEYTEASNYLKSIIAAGIKITNPRIAPEELAKKTVMTYLSYAGAAVTEGKNPAQHIHGLAQEYGYRKAEPAKEVEKPNTFQKVAENKKKSAGMIGAGGSRGEPDTTPEYATKMSNAEFSRLSEVELERLMYAS